MSFLFEYDLSSDHIVTKSLLISMIATQHTQLLKHCNLLFWWALVAFCVTAGIFVAGALAAVADPTGLSFTMLLTLLKAAPSCLISGGLFLQYNRLQTRAADLCRQLAEASRLASAFAASDSIKNLHDRDAAHLKLAERLAS